MARLTGQSYKTPYHPSMPWGAQMSRLSMVSWMTTLVPCGARGLQLKSNFPYRQACAESLGWRRDDLRRMMMMSHWGMSWSHLARGKSGSQVAVFPGLDGTFNQVLLVAVRGNTLEVNVIFSEWLFLKIWAFFVDDLEVWCVFAVLKSVKEMLSSVCNWFSL